MASGDKTYIADKVTQDKILEAVNAIKSDTGSLTGGVKEFTANGTFTVPAGINKILITACAGGQGGIYDTLSITGGTTASYSTGGEGGEWIFKKAFNVTPNQSISITVGKGGAGGENGSSGSGGTVGGNTIIGNLITLLGGGVSGNKSGGKTAGRTNYTVIEDTANAAYAYRGTKAGAGFRDGGNNSVSIYSQYYSSNTNRDRLIFTSGGGGSLGYGESGVLGAGGFGTTDGGDGIVIIEW